MLLELLRAAVADAIDSPDDTCAVLSGGLDSSSVVAVAPEGLACYTGWYDAPGCDEREYARLAARGPHVEVEITPGHLVEHFDAYASAVGHLDDPQGMGGFGQWVVARRIAADGFERVLSGEGADELFGGYVRQLRLLEPGSVPPEYADYVPPPGYPTDHSSALAWDLERLPALLAVDDAVLASHGLEGRAPFTDPRIVDYALALPTTERVWKRHLRAAVRGVVPDEIVDRTDKRGFPTPFVAWANDVGAVRRFVVDRIGYVPDRAAPHARGWWHELIAASR